MIKRGIKENDQVVTTAVAELYGTEVLEVENDEMDHRDITTIAGSCCRIDDHPFCCGVPDCKTNAFDVFPEFAHLLLKFRPRLPDFSSAEVEVLVSIPIENALNGVSWLKNIRSKSVLAFLR